VRLLLCHFSLNSQLLNAFMSRHSVPSTEFVPSRILNVARTSRNSFTALSTEWILLHWPSQHTGTRRYYVKIFCAEFYYTDLHNTEVLDGTTWRYVPNFTALTFTTHRYSKVLREDLLCRIILHWPSQHTGTRRYYVKIFCAEFYCFDLHDTEVLEGTTWRSVPNFTALTFTTHRYSKVLREDLLCRISPQSAKKCE